MNRCWIKPEAQRPGKKPLPLVKTGASLVEVDDDTPILFRAGSVKAAMLSLLRFEDPDDAERFAHKFLCALLGLRNMELDSYECEREDTEYE